MLDGQHKFAAATVIREELTQKDMPLPRWVVFFRCRRVHPDTKLDRRQLIAGREQARSSTVMQQSLSQKLAWFIKEQQAADSNTTRTALLQKVYLKCGCTRTTDGSLVCNTLLPPGCAMQAVLTHPLPLGFTQSR